MIWSIASKCIAKRCHDYNMMLPVYALNMLHEYVSLCVREAKQSAQRKRCCGSPMVSIAEREETDCREGLEPDAAECTTNSANSTDKIEVLRFTVC